MKKAAAEASMQRSKKARMVELFVVRYHVMCPFRWLDALRFCLGWSRRTSLLLLRQDGAFGKRIDVRTRTKMRDTCRNPTHAVRGSSRRAAMGVNPCTHTNKNLVRPSSIFTGKISVLLGVFSLNFDFFYVDQFWDSLFTETPTCHMCC